MTTNIEELKKKVTGSRPSASKPPIEELTFEDRLELFEQELKNQKVDEFPKNVFHPTIEMILENYAKAYAYPRSWYGLGVLTAASVALGNSYGVCYMEGVKNAYGQNMGGFYQKGGIFGAVVSNVASGKSKCEELTCGPVARRNNRVIEDYENRKALWNREKKRIEREEENARKNDDKSYRKEHLECEPILTNFVFDDFTIEALIKGHLKSPRGIAILPDEISGWLKAMGKYKTGGSNDEQQYIKFFDGKEVQVMTIKNGLQYVRNTCVTIYGSIQPGILKELASGDKEASGFFARFLLAFDDQLDGIPPTDNKPDLKSILLYEDIINRIFDFPCNKKLNIPSIDLSDVDNTDNDAVYEFVETIYWKMTPEAKKVFARVRTENFNDKSATPTQSLKGMIGKMDSYILRIAVALKALDIACSKRHAIQSAFKADWAKHLEAQTIDESHLKRAAKIIAHFKQTANKAVDLLKNPVKQEMSKVQQKWYALLPKEPFRPSDAIAIALTKQVGMLSTQKSTLYNWLASRKFFDKDNRTGLYSKKYN